MAIGVALAIAAGQYFFKVSAERLADKPIWYILSLPIFFMSLAVYAGATMGWIMVLRRIPLSQAYPFTALTFLVVPLISYFLLKEPIAGIYWVGLLLILLGLAIIVRA